MSRTCVSSVGFSNVFLSLDADGRNNSDAKFLEEDLFAAVFFVAVFFTADFFAAVFFAADFLAGFAAFFFEAGVTAFDFFVAMIASLVSISVSLTTSFAFLSSLIPSNDG